MKVTIMDLVAGEEEEVILKCASLSEMALALIAELKKNDNARGKATQRLHMYLDGEIHLIEPSAVYYFEYVDQKVFAYCKESVYEIKKKLYELEEILPKQDFIRVSKSTILNLDKISSLAPAFGGRFEANLRNGEKIVISRQYVNALKEALGL